MARAAANVFLGVHGIESEQASRQAKGCDHLLSCGYFVAFLRDRQVSEDDLVVAGERAQQMRCLAIVEGVEAAAQRLAVDRHADRAGGGVSHGYWQFGSMFAESPFKLRTVQTTQDDLSVV